MLSDLLLWRASRVGWVRPSPAARRVAIARRAVDLRRRRGSPRLARALLVLAESQLDNGQLDNGQLEQARQHVDEALESVRDEVTRGDALRISSRALRMLGRPEDAAASAQRAFDTYQEVAGDRPTTRLAGRLVAALEQRILCLTALGRYEQALVAVQEVRRLAEGVPLPRLAANAFAERVGGPRSVMAVAWRVGVRHIELLVRAGRPAEALAVGRDAAEWPEGLARLWGPVAAMRYEALWYLAAAHRLLGETEPAVTTSAAMVDLARRLRPSSLAEALKAHGDLLAGAGRAEAADEARREAQKIFLSLGNRVELHRVAMARVDARYHHDDLAGANSLTADYLPVLRESAVVDPGVFRPVLARTLAVGGVRLLLAGGDGTALVDEAVTVAQDRDDLTLAFCLRRRAIVADRAKRDEAALADALVAARLLLDGAGPEAEKSLDDKELADSLALAARIETRLGRYEQALVQLIAAARTAERLPPATRARTLGNLAVGFGRLHRHAEAIDAATRSIGLRRVLGSADPKNEAELVTALRRRSRDFAAIGRVDEARVDLVEAVTILHRLAATDSDRFGPDLAATRQQQSKLDAASR